jgi:hypothetical protein
MLRRVLKDETAEILTLKNRVSIEIHSASYRSTRGYTIVAALLDELAFWPNEDAAEPDVEVVSQALRQERRSCAGLAGTNAHYEPHCGTVAYRRGDGGRRRKRCS